MYPDEKAPRAEQPLLPLSNATAPALESPTKRRLRTLGFLSLIWLLVYCTFITDGSEAPSGSLDLDLNSFFWTRNDASSICPGVHANASSYSGYIALKGDSEEEHRRSFYWLFKAQKGHENAPIILTIGGGPGTSGLLNPVFGQSHCHVAEDGFVANPNAWSEHFNVLALDHPIGVGFSYGPFLNNSRDAAHDVYDFLQKFYTIYPEYTKSNLVLASGSYGGVYVPHIATVINENNKALAAGHGPAGARHINLESVMISNPLSDALTWFRWMLHTNCYETKIYNSTQCTELYQNLPQCLESVQFAYENPTTEHKFAALETCSEIMTGDTHGKSTDNYKRICDGKPPEECAPAFGWAVNHFNNASVQKTLGTKPGINFVSVNPNVTMPFIFAGDHIQRPYLLHTQLLKDGIRVLHYLGKLDSIAGPAGTMSFLRLLPSQFRDEFRKGQDLPWPSEDVATVRPIGPGAGNFTMVLIAEAGHFVTVDQPKLVKSIVETWVQNKPWF